MSISEIERQTVYKTLFSRRDVRREFKANPIPEEIVPIAYLNPCYVNRFHEKPELGDLGWLPRLPLPSLLHYDKWSHKEADYAE